MTLATVVLITLHLIDGRLVEINPEQVTHLLEARSAGDPKKKLHDKVSCVVRFTDGTYTSVAESCDEVRQLMEGSK